MAETGLQNLACCFEQRDQPDRHRRVVDRSIGTRDEDRANDSCQSCEADGQRPPRLDAADRNGDRGSANGIEDRPRADEEGQAQKCGLWPSKCGDADADVASNLQDREGSSEAKEGR